MKEPKDLTAEDFYNKWDSKINPNWDVWKHEYIYDYAIDFARHHVKQALIAVQELQNLKEERGWIGVLTKEELEEVYSLDNIK